MVHGTTRVVGAPTGALAQRLRQHLAVLYPRTMADEALAALLHMVDDFPSERSALPATRLFDERDVVLITYADQFHAADASPLHCLSEFLSRRLQGTVTGVHLLPFYPWTSDDGFAVADHDRVDPNVGSWEDVEALASRFRVMVDAVFNHVSTSSPWFGGWRTGDPAYEDWFLALDPRTDLYRVVRPRTHPVLTPVETAKGLRHVWTTFSPDQPDVNVANPAVLLALTRSLLGYVARGAGIIRLDAIAFLWKEVGTTCIHLPQTHEIVRLWRTLLDAVAPGTLLITETNVPHQENVRYFGDGTNEAHLVYQFPLAPLVLSAFVTGDARPLQLWTAGLATPSDETTFFNFLGSHDGVGVRPAEGLLADDEIDHLVDVVRARGGGVSYRRMPDGSQRPYELNTVFFDAVNGPQDTDRRRQVDAFLSAQTILLALQGVPGVYVQALLGSRNWHEGVQRTGRLRSINRQKFSLDELERELDDPAGVRHAVFTAFRRLIAVRTSEPAFHPNGPQRVRLGVPAHVVAFDRIAPDGTSGVVCIHEVGGRGHRLELPPGAGADPRQPVRDLVDGGVVRPRAGVLEVDLGPYQVRWLRWPA